jgi:hypothetical protein
MNAAEALQSLKRDPDNFLKHYQVTISGNNQAHNSHNVNTRNFFLYKRNPTAMGTAGKIGHYGNVRPGSILPFMSHNISSFRISTAPEQTGVDQTQFSAISVPMVTYSPNPPFDITQIEPYYVDASQDIMITGQLSGCCFCWLDVGGILWCAHIQPLKGTMDGLHLQTLINTQGHFFSQPTNPLGTFGKHDYVLNNATLIGVKHGGGWKMYAQISGDGIKVSQCFRIFPGARVLL